MKLLVTRFSALGDVAIAKKVILNILYYNPDLEIFLLTKKNFQPLFENIDRLTIIENDLKQKHKGIVGLKKLATEISQKYKITHFADIHDVLRTKILRLFLSEKIVKSVIDKGRKEKKQLIRKKNKKLHQLKNTAERYSEVFEKLGLNFNIKDFEYKIEYKLNIKIVNFLNNKKSIIIAPFAAHLNKTYPIEYSEALIDDLSQVFQIIILGGGKKEKEIADSWEKKYKNVKSAIGIFNLNEEISLIDNCEAIITMDSGNMHLASLTKTKIISIWGATHPYMGFSPFEYSNIFFIQKELFCRPCSIFGSENCYRKNFECLQIRPEEITNLIRDQLVNY